ncbi:hypothetical protein OAG82_04450, partial [Rubripirellula sp.]
DLNFIESKSNKHGIFLALKFEDKVDRFIRLVSERAFPRYNEKYIDRPLDDIEVSKIGNELVDSILNDIYNEQENARESRMWGRSGVNTLLPNLNYLSQRAMNYSITYPQMQENKVSLNLLIELLGSLRALADTAKSVWDSSWLPTSYFKRSRAVSTYMHKQIDSIFTSIFGRELSRWNRITRTDSKDEHSGKSRMNAARGSARHAADQEANKIARQRGKDKSFGRYTRAQQQPGITYDPEVLLPESRVMSGRDFDQLLAIERDAARERQKTEQAVLAKRSDLLVPLARSEERNSLYQQPQSLL